MYPMYKDAIKTAQSDLDTDRPTTSRVDDKGIIFPEDTQTKTEASWGENSEYIRGYERYYKIWVKRFHIKNDIDNQLLKVEETGDPSCQTHVISEFRSLAPAENSKI